MESEANIKIEKPDEKVKQVYVLKKEEVKQEDEAENKQCRLDKFFGPAFAAKKTGAHQG